MLSGVLRGVGAGRKWSIKYAIEAFGGNSHIWELVILCRLCLMTRYKKDGSGERARWALELSSYGFTIKHMFYHGKELDSIHLAIFQS